MSGLRFDQAINAADELIRERLAADLPELTIVRDLAGRITAVLDDKALGEGDWEGLASALHERLGRFSPGVDRILLRRSDLIDEDDVLRSPDRLPLGERLWVVDRLLSNLDWQREPSVGSETSLPLATAFSLKGGVGRSTALGVLAWHLARQGKRVVAIDLDLEAPGLGSLLLGDLPDFGMVDWLAEGLVGPPEPGLLDDCLAFSPVAENAEGVIQVLPAFGTKTRDYVAKLGRAYLPGISASGEDEGLAERIRSLIAELAKRAEPPDAVLLDSRAGLHDIGAAAVTQLGAEAFLFARDEPQSWRAYELLFRHLALSKGVKFGMPDSDLRWRLKMVAAQLDKSVGAIAGWTDASYRTWETLYDEEPVNPGPDGKAQTFERSDPDAPHFPLSIYFDAQFRGLNLVNASERPPWPTVEAAFGEFLAGTSTRLFSPKEGPVGQGRR